ncbi:hypothetical protein DFR29_103288 [Tahibacter aquaticus]|uniref:Uncharacterized protein n=2 Tax=Tahibacter aquaticus TaxID=520092 RepID=A0A4R6Z4Z8_9GAMM|nr:hypothetical protein DFR29_103288 [Tahibacter aquaticus]
MDAPAPPNDGAAARSMLDSTARVVIVGRHALPIVRAWAGLVRAEGDVARDSLSGLLLAAAVGVAGALIFLTALVGGAMLGLRELGWPVWAATALPAGLGLSTAIAAGWVGYTRFVRLTFPQTRRRLGALLEVLDEA